MLAEVKKLIDEKRYNESLSLIDTIENTDEKSAEITFLHGISLLGSGAQSEARNIFTQLAYVVMPHSLDDLITILKLLFKAGGLVEANQIFRTLLADFDGSNLKLDQVFGLIGLCQELDDPAIEIMILESCGDQFSSNASFLTMRASAHYRQFNNLTPASNGLIDGDWMDSVTERLHHLRSSLECISTSLKLDPTNDDVRALANVIVKQVKLYDKSGLIKSTVDDLTSTSTVSASLAHDLMAVARKGSLAKTEQLSKMLLENAENGSQKQFNPFSALICSDDPAFILARNIEHANTIGLGSSRASQISKSRDERYVIGYFSADFGNHPVTHLLLDLIASHDRKQFKIVCFALREHPPGFYSRRVKELSDHYVDCSLMRNSDIARLAQEMGVDIAIDLSGYTQGFRPNLFAYLRNCIKVNFLGYPSSMGSGIYDYLIGDEIVIPFENEQYFSEKIIRLNRSFMCNSPSRRVDNQVSRKELSLPDDAFIFCNFNAQSKVNRGTLEIWREILKKTPDALLWLPDHGVARRQEYEEIFQKQASQLIYAPYVDDHSSHLARLGCADLMLDNFPYGAHATAADAILQGLPVLSRSGRSFQSRVACSLMTYAGIDYLDASDWQTYVEKASSFLSSYSPDKRESIRNRLLNDSGSQHPCNVREYCFDFESRLVEAHKVLSG